MARARQDRLQPYKDPKTGKWKARAHNPAFGVRPNAARYVFLGRYDQRGPCRRRGETQCCAAHRIDEYHRELERPGAPETLRDYFATWQQRWPRTPRTDETNRGRIKAVIEVKIEGVVLGDWIYRDLKRRHVVDLVTHMLTVQKRTHTGVQNHLRVLSAMTENAITDEIAEPPNAFKGLRIRGSDPRIQKARPEPILLTMEEMHAFAAAAGRYEPMVRVLADCGPRIGELFALRRTGLDLKEGWLHVNGTVWNGQIVGSSHEKQHDRRVPIPPGCAALLRAMPTRIDSEWLFPATRGGLWWVNNFYRTVWRPAKEATGIECSPQDFRSSWESHLWADPEVDNADILDYAGHGWSAASQHYIRSLGRSADAARRAIG